MLLLRKLLPLSSLLACLVAAPVWASCSNPTGSESALIYNAAYHTYQFCNGTSWIAAGGSTSVGGTVGAQFTQSGYFVMSKTTWTGSLGGASGADAKCLTEIGTTNTGWMGYSTANSNGQLVAGNVHAFVCTDDLTWCNAPFAGATYYFANANNATYGGASFTVDQFGDGQVGSANWSGTTYFGGSYSYWTGARDDGYSTGTYWQNDLYEAGGCTSWSDALSSDNAFIGESNFTEGTRYGGASGTNPTDACNVAINLICYVNPLK
jgi:hypothetical protein